MSGGVGCIAGARVEFERERVNTFESLDALY
jgi:hypothetical protein